MSDAISIGTAMAVRGQASCGFVTVGETATGPVQFPVSIIRGEADGPTLALTAGVHATEYALIDALMRLLHEVTPRALRGTIIAVPVVSMHMFAARMPFLSPLDGVNLNKIAPGGQGTITERVAHALFEEVICRAQYHIDLHAGDFGEMLLEFAGYSLTGDKEQDHKGEALARIFTPEIFCLAPQGTTLPPSPGFVAHAAARKGIVSILAEAGGNGTLEEADVGVHLNGMRNVLRYLKMIDGEPVLARRQVRATGWHNTRTTSAGLMRLKVKVGDQLQEGQEVATIHDIFGRTVETVRVEKPGIAMLVWAHKAVNTGDPVVRCWSVEPADHFPETDQFITN